MLKTKGESELMMGVLGRGVLKLTYRTLSDEHYRGSVMQGQAEVLMEKMKAIGGKEFSKLLVSARKEVEEQRAGRRMASA